MEGLWARGFSTQIEDLLQRNMDDRERVVNDIIETFKRDCGKSSGPDELSKIATPFEEKTMYMASTSLKSDYPWKVSTILFPKKKVSTKTTIRFPKKKVSTIRSNSAASIASTAQTGHNAVDWQEEIYQKIKSMRELYLSDLNDMYQKISKKIQQHDLVARKSEQIERLKLFKNFLERALQFLNVPKNHIVPAVKDKISTYEKQIIGILNRPRKPVSAQQEVQQPGGHPLSMQPQQPQEQQQQQQHQPDNQMNHQMQSTDMQNSVSSSKQSTAVTSTHHGAMPLLSNHMELSSAQTIQSIYNTNMFKLQCLEQQKQQLEQQFRECQMYQQWINQQMQHVLPQQQQILQEQQQQIPQLQQQLQQLALKQQSVQLQAANQMSQLQVTPHQAMASNNAATHTIGGGTHHWGGSPMETLKKETQPQPQPQELDLSLKL